MTDQGVRDQKGWEDHGRNVHALVPDRDAKTHTAAHAKQRLVRDVIHGYIEITPLAKQWIDTTEFQELRQIKQLGMASLVFADAEHSRFKHCIGVYHLCRKFMQTIWHNQPELEPRDTAKRERLTELVGVAGLLHDIGHYAFSHVFDEVAAKDLGLPDHEQRGVAMVREMVIKYSIPLTTAEVDAICGMILGDSKQVEPKWLCAFVHNRVNELDCDKLDYLQRDSYHSGLSRQIQVDRLRKHMRVLPVGGDLQLCFHRKVYMQIADVFYARYRNFRELYRQKTVIAIDVMIDDLFRIVKPVLKYFVDRKRRITDSLIQNLPDLLPLLPPGTLAEAEQQKALALWQRIQTRKLYKATLVEPADKGLPGSLIIKVRLSLSSLADNPLDHIYFYDDSGSVAHLAQETLVKLLPATVSCCTETLHYHISKT